jgi:hypothetical protein
VLRYLIAIAPVLIVAPASAQRVPACCYQQGARDQTPGYEACPMGQGPADCETLLEQDRRGRDSMNRGRDSLPINKD